jgi:hypothetical protein
MSANNLLCVICSDANRLQLGHFLWQIPLWLQWHHPTQLHQNFVLWKTAPALGGSAGSQHIFRGPDFQAGPSTVHQSLGLLGMVLISSRGKDGREVKKDTFPQVKRVCWTMG